MSFSEFETRLQFIDRNFVHERHAIAHGEGRPLTEKEFLRLESDVTLLMDIFKNNILDSAERANNFLNSGKLHTCLTFVD